jgi:hypothetical protein
MDVSTPSRLGTNSSHLSSVLASAIALAPCALPRRSQESSLAVPFAGIGVPALPARLISPVGLAAAKLNRRTPVVNTPTPTEIRKAR